MAKYKGENRIQEDDRTYAEQFAELSGQTEETSPEPQDAEDATYKKRYGDLRRHTQQLMQQKDNELAEIKRQLDQAAKGQIRFPKTDEEIEAWSKKYPDVAKIVDTIAAKRANEAMQGLREGEKRLVALETKLTKKDAEQQLMKLHPDFAEIRQDPSFHDWVALQPAYIQDALYKNNTDAMAASRAIDLYKADTGRKKTKGKKSAAESVGRTNAPTPPSQGRAKFSESQVNSMSQREYEQNEDAILQAMRDGNFVYDMTGAAR